MNSSCCRDIVLFACDVLTGSLPSEGDAVFIVGDES